MRALDVDLKNIIVSFRPRGLHNVVKGLMFDSPQLRAIIKRSNTNGDTKLRI